MRADAKARSAESRRRAAGYLAQLAWLAGFPTEPGRWQPLAQAAAIALDGDLIARSRRIGRTLLREHRQALRGLVGDVDRWWAIVDATLAWCSKPVGALDLSAHAPPRITRKARELAAGAPGLRPAIDAALVAWAHEPEELSRALAWLGRHPTELGAQELAIAVGLARLATIDARGADAALALLVVDAPDGKQSVQYAQLIERAIRAAIAPSTPPVWRSTSFVLPWLRKLIVEPEPRHALALLAAVDLAGALAPWADWERTHAARFARAQHFTTREFESEEPHRERAIAGLRAAYTAIPAPIDVSGALAGLSLVAGDARYRVAATRFIAALPASLDAAVRPRMLLHVARVVASADNDERPAWLWDAFADELAQAHAAPSELLRPWRSALEREAYARIEDDAVEAKLTRAQVRALASSLARLSRDGSLAGNDPEIAIAWLSAGLAGDALDMAVARLRLTLRDFTAPVARAAVALAADPSSTDELATHAIALLEAIGDRWRARNEVLALVEHAAHDGATWILRDALARTRGADIVAAAGMAALVPRSRWPSFLVVAPTSRAITSRPARAATPASSRARISRGKARPRSALPAAGPPAPSRRASRDPALGPPAAWMARYPAELVPALHRLAAVAADAEAIAARRLATDLPDPAALRREIVNLRGRETLSERMAIRLANLEQRLHAPRLPSPRRLAHLAERLDQTAATLALARFTERITAAATDRLVRAFELGSWPGWPLEPRDREVLFELLRLREPARSLAGRLLRARMGPRPWDLRDDPANRAFLDAMRARGVDPVPWLDSTPRTYRANDGKPIELALCDDPLEVFAMGWHFETCLAPDHGNFFSVVANAADINKRVLYARRDGRVVARCLFAITSTHALLTFHVYSHITAAVHELVRVFAIDLAERMHTTIVPRGTVATLLAHDWYDDGPRDLVGRFAALDRLDFAPLDATTLVPALRDALGHELDDITLPIVVAHDGLQRRPHLIAALAPQLLASRTLPPVTRCDAACVAMRAGDLALADHLLGDHTDSIPIYDYALYTHAVLLARLRPSIALARLRATRDRSVRRAEDDSPDRNALAGIALHALHRPRQAAALFAIALRARPELRRDLEYYDIDPSVLEA